MTTERTDDPRALIRYALLGIALTTALFWMLFQIRETLLLIYVAALIAIGLSPLVLAIQKHPRTPRREQVPECVADDVAVLRLDPGAPVPSARGTGVEREPSDWRLGWRVGGFDTPPPARSSMRDQRPPRIGDGST